MSTKVAKRLRKQWSLCLRYSLKEYFTVRISEEEVYTCICFLVSGEIGFVSRTGRDLLGRNKNCTSPMSAIPMARLALF